MRIKELLLSATIAILAGPAQAQFVAAGPLVASMMDVGVLTRDWTLIGSQPPLSSPRATGLVAVAAPRGFTAMCERSPDLCVLSSPSSVSELDDRAKLRLLSRVTRRVNRDVRPQADDNGTDDDWVRPGLGGAGDCEDYAIEKREHLRASGFPSSDLTLAVVYRRDIGLHTVLVAQVDGQDYVLDNLSPWVTRASRIPYTWVKRQVPGESALWASVLPQGEQTIAAGAGPERAASSLAAAL